MSSAAPESSEQEYDMLPDSLAEKARIGARGLDAGQCTHSQLP